MKKDMSKICGLCQEKMWAMREAREITEAEFLRWYNAHCAKCVHESEVCMYQNNIPPVDINRLLTLHPNLSYMFM